MNTDTLVLNLQACWNLYQQNPKTFKNSAYFKFLEDHGKDAKELSFRASTLRITDDFLEIILLLCPNIETLDLTIDRESSSRSPQEIMRSYQSNLVNFSQLTNEGLVCLSKLVNLKTLKIEGSTYLRAPCLEHLSGLTNLKSLTLKDLSGLKDEGLAALSKLINLESLDLSGCWSLRSKGLACIAGFTKLQILNLSGCNMLRAECFVHFAGLINLQSLNLFGCERMWGPESKHLIGLTNLKHLNLCCSDILNTDLQFVARLTSLESLDLGGNDMNLSDEGLSYLVTLTNLKLLNLEMCSEITDAGLVYISKLINLESLDLGQCYLISDAGLKHLAGLTSLKSLNLEMCDQITDVGHLWAEQFCSRNNHKIDCMQNRLINFKK